MKRAASLVALATLVGFCYTANGSIIYGDYDGGPGGVIFRDVTETTATPGDPEPLFEAPVIVDQNTLSFSPSHFVAVAPPVDATSGMLEMLIDLPAGKCIETISVYEVGDYSLLGFSPLVQATLAMIVSNEPNGVDVLDTVAVSEAFAVPGGSLGASDVFDLRAVIDLSGLELEDVYLRLNNTLQAVDAGGSAFIQKKMLVIDVDYEDVPEPATMALVAIGAWMALRRR